MFTFGLFLWSILTHTSNPVVAINNCEASNLEFTDDAAAPPTATSDVASKLARPVTERMALILVNPLSPSDSPNKEKQCLTYRSMLGLAMPHSPNLKMDCLTAKPQTQDPHKILLTINHDKTNQPETVTLERLNRENETLYKTSWNITTKTKEANLTGLAKLTASIGRSLEHEADFKDLAVITGIGHSTAVSADEQGHFRNLSTQEILNSDEAYQLYTDESSTFKAYGRTFIELTILFGCEEAWYWSNIDFNRADWQLGWDRESWRKKLITGDGVRFDSNSMGVNIVSHPFIGAATYEIARANRLNPLESFLMSATLSTLWEYLAEFRELVSINDLILTPFAGSVIGEVFSQLGSYLEEEDDSVLNAIFSGLLNPVRPFHKLITLDPKGRSELSAALKARGFSSRRFHEFNVLVSSGISHHRTAGSQAVNENQFVGAIDLRTRIVTIPTYNRDGKVAKWLHDGNFTDMKLKIQAESNGAIDIEAFFKAAFMGYYQQNTVAQTAENQSTQSLTGYTFFIGLSSAFDLGAYGWKSATAGETKGDLAPYGIAHLLGPTLDLNLFYKGLHVHAVFDFYGDFAAIRSMSAIDFINHAGVYGLDSTLQYFDYYFGMGLTFDSAIKIDYANLSAGVECKFTSITSLEGKDRYQEWVSRETSNKDSFLKMRAWLGYTFPAYRLSLLAAIELNRDESDMLATDYNSRLIFERLMTSLSVSYPF